jgi:hypothetical protein
MKLGVKIQEDLTENHRLLGTKDVGTVPPKLVFTRKALYNLGIEATDRELVFLSNDIAREFEGWRIVVI